MEPSNFNRGRMMPIFKPAAMAALLLIVAAPARATIVQTYADATAFAAAGTVSVSPLGAPGDPLVFFPAFNFGDLGITARDGDLAGQDVLLSSGLDSDQLTLTFARPVFAVSIRGLVTDADFAAIGGTLRLEVVGQDGTDLAVSARGPSFLGLRTDTPFTQLTIDVGDYDVDASSVAFATLDTEVGAVFAPVAEPGALAAMLVGGIGALMRRRTIRVSR